VFNFLLRLKPKDEFEKEKFELLNKDLRRRHAQLNEMEESLPKKSGSYLKIILGSVNVSFLNKQERQVINLVGCTVIPLNLPRTCPICFCFVYLDLSTKMSTKNLNWP
jgi:hypothetical protein